MVNKGLKPKINTTTATEFFVNGKLADPSKVSTLHFRDQLRDKVLQEYLNYDDRKVKGAAFIKEDAATPFWKLKLFKLMLSGMAVVAAIILIASFTYFPPSTHFGQNKQGDVAYTEGNVLYKNKDSGWQNATAQTDLSEGATIKIVGTGKAIIDLADGSSVRLNSDTAVTLTSLDPDHIVINNDQGEVYSRVIKDSREFDVIAAGITYRAGGTAFKTLCLTDNVAAPEGSVIIKNGVEVYESQVKIIGSNLPEIVVNQGEKYWTVNTESPEQALKILTVSLAEIGQNGFTMWNKSQDEQSETFKNQLGILTELITPSLAPATPGTTSPAGLQGVMTPTPVFTMPPVNTVNALSLTAGSVPGKVIWHVTGYATDGYQLSWTRTDAQPGTGSGTKTITISNPSVKNYIIDTFQGYGTYKVRVCAFNKTTNSCYFWSNILTVNIDLPEQTTTPVPTIIFKPKTSLIPIEPSYPPQPDIYYQ